MAAATHSLGFHKTEPQASAVRRKDEVSPSHIKGVEPSSPGISVSGTSLLCILRLLLTHSSVPFIVTLLAKISIVELAHRLLRDDSYQPSDLALLAGLLEEYAVHCHDDELLLVRTDNAV